MQNWQGSSQRITTRVNRSSVESTILFSSVILSDSRASLNGDSNSKGDNILIYPLLSISSTAEETINVLACFRNPIPYLRSKYIRTCLHRSSRKARNLSPHEYIQKQAILESNNPGTSALTPAMHAEFINNFNSMHLSKHSAFKTYLHLKDISLDGREKTNILSETSPENKLLFTKSRAGNRREITRHSSNMAFMINNGAQMFENLTLTKRQSTGMASFPLIKTRIATTNLILSLINDSFNHRKYKASSPLPCAR